MAVKRRCELQSLHNHSLYSDGKYSLEEMVLKAIELGFDSFGFAEHSFISWLDQKWLLPEKTKQYQDEIDALGEKYRDRIRLYKGIELDSCSDVDLSGFDFVIGNVHVVPMWDGEYMEYCHSPVSTARKFLFYYDFDTVAFAKDYFDRYLSNFDRAHIDIAGHFDICTKYEKELTNLFDFGSEKYKDLARQVLRAVKEKCDIFEVNAGCVGRGLHPYPSPEPFLLKEIKEIGGKVLVTTDAHAPDLIPLAIDETFELLLSCGFDSIAVLTDHGFEEQKIL